jgi:hypothetical protein
MSVALDTGDSGISSGMSQYLSRSAEPVFGQENSIANNVDNNIVSPFTIF